jgi:hypothetical protein
VIEVKRNKKCPVLIQPPLVQLKVLTISAPAEKLESMKLEPKERRLTRTVNMYDFDL